MLKKTSLFTLLSLALSATTEPWEPIKIFDRTEHIAIGIYTIDDAMHYFNLEPLSAETYSVDLKYVESDSQ